LGFKAALAQAGASPDKRAVNNSMIRFRNLTILFLILFLPLKLMAAQRSGPAKLTVFYSPSCHRCLEIKREVLPRIETEFKDKVILEYRDISDIENYKMLIGLLQASKLRLEFDVPLFYLEGRFLTSEGQVYPRLRDFILEGVRREEAVQSGPADLVEHFKSFVPAAVIFAGLSDGINPCAFTVIVFFISFLALQGYRKKELILIGAAFIFAVFLTYLGLGLGIFNFFYHFRGFWLAARLFNVVIGVFSIILGILAVYDFIQFKKSGSTQELILQLPKPVKERIHQVVGFFYRRSRQEKQQNLKPPLLKLVASALITGFLVSLLEAVCTGQVYLPTITFVLKSTNLKLQACGYLLLYNIMFTVPLIAVFILALLGTSSQQFSGFLMKRMGIIKILMVILFFGLGIILLWRA